MLHLDLCLLLSFCSKYVWKVWNLLQNAAVSANIVDVWLCLHHNSHADSPQFAVSLGQKYGISYLMWWKRASTFAADSPQIFAISRSMKWLGGPRKNVQFGAEIVHFWDKKHTGKAICEAFTSKLRRNVPHLTEILGKCFKAVRQDTASSQCLAKTGGKIGGEKRGKIEWWSSRYFSCKHELPTV